MTIGWNPPAGGLWELESTHVRGGQPRIFQDRAPRAFRDGFAGTAARYGLPIDYLDVRFVNDHCYARMRPVGAPEPKPGKPTGRPPDLVLWVLARLHPELRRRTRAARRAIEQKLWHEDRCRWEQHDRPEMLAINRALQAEPIEQLGDGDLVGHLRRSAEHFERGIAMHLGLTPVYDLTVGRLVRACRAWGIGDAEAFSLLGGHSPASTASAAGLAAIADGVRIGRRRAAVSRRRACRGTSRRSGPRHLSRRPRLACAHPVFTQRTHPDRAAGPSRAGHQSVDREKMPVPVADADTVRSRVPSADRARFDNLLDDARRCYGVRDDNVALTFMWPAGLLRRALLECGHRLAARGRLNDEAHVFALSEHEIADALAGDPALADVAATRTALLEAAEAADPPVHLGTDEGPPPDPDLFPAPLADLVSAILVGFELDAAFQGEHHTAADWSGNGVGIGTVPYTGRTCVAADATDALARLQAGDVLVTTLTTPAFEAVMSIAGAVVTEVGGLTSHTAICCREHGIPAVVRVNGATTHIPNGAIVRVDPTTGQVCVEATTTKQGESS